MLALSRPLGAALARRPAAAAAVGDGRPAVARCCWCRRRPARPRSASAATTRRCGWRGRRPRSLRATGADDRRRSGAADVPRRPRPGRARGAGPGREPGRRGPGAAAAGAAGWPAATVRARRRRGDHGGHAGRVGAGPAGGRGARWSGAAVVAATAATTWDSGLSLATVQGLAFRHGTRPGPWLRRTARPSAGQRIRQADASRRRNGPRKATSRRPITVRLRSKSCPAGGPDGPPTREKGSSGGHRCETLSRRMWGRRPGRPGGCHRLVHVLTPAPRHQDPGIRGGSLRGHRRQGSATPRSPSASATHVAEKLAKIEKLDPKVISVDVECSQETQPAARRPARAHRDHHPVPRPGHARRGRRTGLLRRARRWP